MSYKKQNVVYTHNTLPILYIWLVDLHQRGQATPMITYCIEVESILVSRPAARRIADIQLARIPEVTADRM